MNRVLSIRQAVSHTDSRDAVQYLAAISGLSKMKVKDAMAKGAVWLTRPGRSRSRLRRAKARLWPGDTVELHYDPAILALIPPETRCIQDFSRYGIWRKPAGMLTQGTDFGDHCSVLRQVALFYDHKRKVFPVHRLDREASGLVILAHDKKAAAALSALFSGRRVVKTYRAEVLGDLGNAPEGRFDEPLDGKSAVTTYTLKDYRPDAGISKVEIIIETGRKHQIRRHFSMAGHPVMGDPRYGNAASRAEGLRLEAVGLSFHCPLTGDAVDIRSG